MKTTFTSGPNENPDILGERGFKWFKKKKKVNEYVNDKEKSKELLDSAIEKANRKKGALSEVWENLQLLIELFGDWIKGNYKEIPIGSIIIIIVGLLYFVVPADLIPDILIGLGLIDDAAVLGFVIKQVYHELQKYKEWKENMKNSNVIDKSNDHTEESSTKECPLCAESIKANAKTCRYCHHEFGQQM